MRYKYRFRINNQGTKVLNASYQYGHDAAIVRDEEDNKNPYCFFTSLHLTNLKEPKEILFDLETDMNITPFDTHEISQTYPFDDSLVNLNYIMVKSNPVCNLKESDLSDFTGTANNYGLIGANARHGDKGWSAPANPLTLREAQCLILGLCREYLVFTSN